jgi:hypothetical protein
MHCFSFKNKDVLVQVRQLLIFEPSQVLQETSHFIHSFRLFANLFEGQLVMHYFSSKK